MKLVLYFHVIYYWGREFFKGFLSKGFVYFFTFSEEILENKLLFSMWTLVIRYFNWFSLSYDWNGQRVFYKITCCTTLTQISINRPLKTVIGWMQVPSHQDFPRLDLLQIETRNYVYVYCTFILYFFVLFYETVEKTIFYKPKYRQFSIEVKRKGIYILQFIFRFDAIPEWIFLVLKRFKKDESCHL